MKEYIEHKRYTELITGQATSKEDRKTTSKKNSGKATSKKDRKTTS